MKAEPRNNDAGFALITVLWAMGLLSVLVILILRTGAGDSLALDQDLAERRAGILALSEVELTRAGLIAGRPPALDLELDMAKPKTVTRHSSRLVPEASRLDVNRADEVLIRALLEAAGESPGDARETAQKIIDYRSETAPFRDLEELVSLGLVSPGLFDVLHPALTLHGRTVIETAHMPEVLERARRRLTASEQETFFADPRSEKDDRLAAGDYGLEQTIVFADGRSFHYDTVIRYRPGFENPAAVIAHRRSYPGAIN